MGKTCLYEIASEPDNACAGIEYVAFHHPNFNRAGHCRRVLPQFGLAYLVDHQEGQWTITRQTPGLGLDDLMPGQHVHLTLAHDEKFTWVCHYRTVP